MYQFPNLKLLSFVILEETTWFRKLGDSDGPGVRRHITTYLINWGVVEKPLWMVPRVDFQVKEYSVPGCEDETPKLEASES